MRNLVQVLLWICFLVAIVSVVINFMMYKSRNKPLRKFSMNHSPFTTRQARKRLMRRFS